MSRAIKRYVIVDNNCNKQSGIIFSALYNYSASVVWLVIVNTSVCILYFLKQFITL